MSDPDPRLDNREGAQRPPLEEFPAVPQQVDGPDLAGQAKHSEKALAGDVKDDVSRKGQYSPGPHGLSGEELRETKEATFGTEGVKGE